MIVDEIDKSALNANIGKSWVQKSFYLKNVHNPEEGSDKEAIFARGYTTAMIKFTDTTLGGNLSINPLPQPSLWTDPPPVPYKSSVSALKNTPLQGGMYSEVYDDNQQIIYMRFGVPVFNSITGFYSRFYDSTYARLIRSGGVSESLSGSIGYAIGSVLASPLKIAAFGFNTLEFFSDIIGGAWDFVNRKSSKFYYFKSTMPLYWAAAQGIMNHIAVNKGFMGPYTKGGDAPDTISSSDPAYDDVRERDQMSKMYGDIFTPSGNINLYGVVTRAQRLHNSVMKNIEAGGNVREKMLSLYRDRLNMKKQAGTSIDNFSQVFSEFLNKNKSGDIDDGLADESANIQNEAGKMTSAAKAHLNDGGEFIGFRVNHTGAATESFSSSFKESEIAQFINGASSSARSARFNLNNGNISDFAPIQILQGAVQGIVDGVSDLATSVGLGGVGVLMGNAQVDIPKFWERSDTNFSSKSYTIDLISPSGDVYSQLSYIYAPLSLLLAGALARSTGRHSYTEPFLCQLFDKGRAQTRLGMIKSMTVTRGGSGNVAWTTNHEPLYIRVQFEVEDMESVMHMPVVTSMGTGASAIIKATAAELLGEKAGVVLERGWFDMENTFIDYMGVLGSLDLTAQIYFTRKMLRRWEIHKRNHEITTSKAYMTAAITNNELANVVRLFTTGTFAR